MRVLLIQNAATEDFGWYEFWLRSEGHECLRVRAYEAQDLPPLGAWDAAIVGGTPFPANSFCADRRYRREWMYLRSALKAGKPFLGICSGARVLARLLGARVHAMPRAEVGLGEVRLTEAGAADPLFEGFPRDFPVFQWHKDTFEVPPGAAWLATGDADRIQAFRKGNVAGLAFHLEVDAQAAGAWADAYPAELRAAGARRDRMIRALEEEDLAIRGHAFRLVRNYVKMVGGSSASAASAGESSAGVGAGKESVSPEGSEADGSETPSDARADAPADGSPNGSSEGVSHASTNRPPGPSGYASRRTPWRNAEGFSITRWP